MNALAGGVGLLSPLVYLSIAYSGFSTIFSQPKADAAFSSECVQVELIEKH